MATWLSFTIWMILTTLLFIVLARWSVGEGPWGGMAGIVRGFHDWATGEAPHTAHASSSNASSGSSPSGPVAEIEEL